MGASHSGFAVEGKRIEPPPRPFVPPDPKETMQRFSERRERELEMLAEKQRLKKEKTMQKAARSERLRKSLQQRVLGRQLRSASLLSDAASFEEDVVAEYSSIE